MRDNEYYEKIDARSKYEEVFVKFSKIEAKFNTILKNNNFSEEEGIEIKEIQKLNNEVVSEVQATANEYTYKDDKKAIMEVTQMLYCAIDNYQDFIDKLDPATESESTKKIKVSALTYIADVFKQIFQKLGEFINRKHKVENILELEEYEHPKVKHNKEGISVDILAEAGLGDLAAANLGDKGNSPSGFSKLCTDAQHRIGQWFKKAEIKAEIELITLEKPVVTNDENESGEINNSNRP